MAHEIRRTVLPKSQYEVSTGKEKTLDRAKIRSRKSDTLGDYSVGFYKIDDGRLI